MPGSTLPRVSWTRWWLLVVVAVAAACSSGPVDTPEPDRSPSAAERIDAIRAARSEVAGPAVDLRNAVAEVVAALETLRADPPVEPERRLGLLDAVPPDALAALDDAIEQARRVQLDPATGDVDAAAVALADAVERAEEVRATARDDIDAQRRVAEADAALASLVERWDQRGSRREQLEAFGALAAEADTLAEELDDLPTVAPCLEGPSRRAEAARTVAETTRELRGYIERYQGNTFDERRAELEQDPYGLGEPLAAGDADEYGCWEREAPVRAAASEVDAALARLEAALNPSDLRTGGSG